MKLGERRYVSDCVATAHSARSGYFRKFLANLLQCAREGQVSVGSVDQQARQVVLVSRYDALCIRIIFSASDQDFSWGRFVDEISWEELDPITDEPLLEPAKVDKIGLLPGGISALSFHMPDYVFLMNVASDIYAAFFHGNEGRETDSSSD